MAVYRVFSLHFAAGPPQRLYWKQWFMGSRYACERYVDRAMLRHGTKYPCSPESKRGSYYITYLTPKRFKQKHGKLRWGR